MTDARTERQLARRRGKRIMGLFYRMAATWWWAERVQVPAAPSPEAREALRLAMWTRLGAQYLLSARADLFPPAFTQALAAASLGQGHRATLPDGTPVVVKVLRPGVDTLIRAVPAGHLLLITALLMPMGLGARQAANPA